MPKILKFGTITESDGNLLFRDFHVDGENSRETAETILLEATILRLQQELAKLKEEHFL